MTYPNLFNSYRPLKGRGWLRELKQQDPEAVKAFVYIGLREAGFGQKGGRALYMKKGRSYMSEIGRRGALVTNIKKAMKKAIQEETEKEFGVTFDF